MTVVEVGVPNVDHVYYWDHLTNASY